MHVEIVPASTLDCGAVVTSELALVTWHFELIKADGAVGVADVPLPSGHS